MLNSFWAFLLSLFGLENPNLEPTTVALPIEPNPIQPLPIERLLPVVDAGVPVEFPVVDNIRTTLWAPSTGIGGCQMPETAYVVDEALALGQIAGLDYLTYSNNLCGHVLLVDCAGRQVEAVVVSTCGSCGLDLITRTWYNVTDALPGVMSCSARLTDTRPMGGNSSKCFQRPDTTGTNLYYRSVGIYNTGEKLVESMTLGSVRGYFNSGSVYMDFSGSGFMDDTPVSVVYTDGSSEQFRLGECSHSPETHIWS